MLENRYWSPRTIRLLIEHGANVRQTNHWRDTALHLALGGTKHRGLEDIHEALLLLIQAGADVHAKNWYGCTPSHRACHLNAKYHVKPSYSRQRSSDLALRKVWAAALSDCGYDAEEVILRSVGKEIAEHGWNGSRRLGAHFLFYKEEPERSVEAEGHWDLLENECEDDEWETEEEEDEDDVTAD